MRALNVANYQQKTASKPKSERSAAENPAALLRVKRSSSYASKQRIENASVVAPSKFGISISKKVSKRAVVRNRIKRQIKAVLQRYLPDITPNWQVVIVVRPSAVECEFADFLRELEYLLRKLRITDTRSVNTHS